jgi:hypothetical protein
MTSRITLPIAIILAACGSAAAGPGIPAPVNAFRPEDRVVIGDFSFVNAIASTTDRVYVVYPDAVAIWHPVERRWDVPRAPPRADRLRTVTAAVVDPLDRSLWLRSAETWLHYDPLANLWDEPPVPLRELPRPTGVEDAMRDLPQLRALAPHIATGPLMVPGTLTAAAPDPQRNGWFLGTSTRGLVFFDRMAVDATPIPLGLSGNMVGALLPVPDGIWVATDADLRRPSSVSHLADDLIAATPIAGSRTTGLPFSAARAFLVKDRWLWIATDKGVVRTSEGDGRLDRYDISTGLPDERVLAVAQFGDQVIAATMRGLAMSRGDSGFVRIAPTFGEPVYAVLASADTLWVGSSRGLFAFIAGRDELAMPEGFRQLAGSAVPVLGIGYVADTLVAMTADRLLARDPGTGAWSAGPILSAQLGSLVAFAPTRQGAWIGGARGVGFVQPGSGALRLLMAGLDLPDEVTTVAASGRYLWIGTRRGLVRYLLTEQ